MISRAPSAHVINSSRRRVRKSRVLRELKGTVLGVTTGNTPRARTEENKENIAPWDASTPTAKNVLGPSRKQF
ncbi:uncharacterized protein SCHCODRAFT_0111062 [Schizophyllum commune H4-8]